MLSTTLASYRHFPQPSHLSQQGLRLVQLMSPSCGMHLKQIGSSNFRAEPTNQSGKNWIGEHSGFWKSGCGLDWILENWTVREVSQSNCNFPQKNGKVGQDFVEKRPRTGRALRMRLMRTAEGLEARSLRRHEALTNAIQ